MDIHNLLKSPEGKTLEFKRDLSSPKSVLRTIIAFANTAGGTIVIGVEDEAKNIFGIEDPYLLEEKISNLISDNILPQILPDIEIIPWRNIYLLTIQIFPSSARPHYFKQDGLEKGVYIRVGSTNRLADNLMQAELRRIKIEDSFDKQPLPMLSSEDIDFRAASELFLPLKKLTTLDLESLDFITTYQNKKVPTTGGIILFGKDRLKYFPDSWVQAGRFSGITKTKIFDSQNIVDYPTSAIEQAMLFIKKHSMHSLEVHSDLTIKNKSTWNLPLTAIREALINAIVHADYSQQGAPIRLSIFDDRIEIENPGLLLFGLTIDDLKRGVSKLRNRVIGQVFYRLGLIERWGSGINRILDSCKEAGFPEPLFEEIGTHFRVTLFTQIVAPLHLSDSDQLIIQALQKTNGLSTKEISDIIGKSTRTTRTRLLTLIQRELIVDIGIGVTDPHRKYFIK